MTFAAMLRSVSRSRSSWRCVQLALSRATSSQSVVVRSRFPDVDTPRMNYADYVLREAPVYGNRAALIDGVTGRSWAYNELDTARRRVASALTRRGLVAGQVVCVFLHNCPEYALAKLGVLSTGAVVTPTNPTYTARELAYQLGHSRAQWLVTNTELLSVANEAARATAEQGASNICGIFLTDVGHDAAIAKGALSFGDLLEDDGGADPTDSVGAKVDALEDTAVIPYSSGTTGLPKGVMLTHSNIGVNLAQVRPVTGTKCGEEVFLGLLPFYHIYGLIPIMGAALDTGTTLVTLPKFEPVSFLSTVEKYRMTTLHLVPPLLLFLLNSPIMERYDLSSVTRIMIGAAPLDNQSQTSVQEKLERLYGHKVDVAQGYGLTETSPVTHLVPRYSDPHRCGEKMGSVGTPLPSQLTRVRCLETGQDLGPNESGEILIKGPHVMKGYLDNEKATSESIDSEGWYRTGDIGYYDSDRYFYISDRLKELIKVKGLQVAPAELEGLLLSLPGVVDAAVVGRPDEAAGELPVAFVVRGPDEAGQSLTEEQVAAAIESQVARHKRLAGGVIFVDSIFKTASGKILRRLLKEKVVGSRLNEKH